MKFLTGLMAMVATIGLAGSAAAATVDIGSMTINAFGFSMGHPTGAEPATGTIQFPPPVGAIPNNFNDSFAESINLVMNAGTHQGVPNFSAGSPPLADKTTGIAGFDFSSFGPTAAFTAARANNMLAGDPDRPAWSGTMDDVTGEILSLNLEAWTAGWNGETFTQGSASPTINPVATGTYTQVDQLVVWTSVIVGGSFDGQTGHWYLDVTPTAGAAVPEPMSMALVGSSIIGLIGLRRRLVA